MSLKTKLKKIYYQFWFKHRLKNDEFHPSLSLDADLMMELNNDELQYYYQEIARLRTIAHELDTEREDRERDS